MFSLRPNSMPLAFFKLHLSVVLAGFTGVLGKLISLNEGVLVWWRLLLTSVLFTLLLGLRGNFPRLPVREVMRIGLAGSLLALHWIFFYGSIKASNVSVGVVCFSTVGFFTALLEPVADHKRLSAREMAYSLLTVAGVSLIFHFDARYRLGIGMGIVGAVLAALFTIVNKKVGRTHTASTMLAYEMIGGLMGLSLLLPLYFLCVDVTTYVPGPRDLFWLLCLSVFCTIGLYILQIQALQRISAFTVNLTYNLEPLYSIALAMLFLGEAQELTPAFYAGLGLIFLSVALQTLSVMRRSGHFADVGKTGNTAEADPR